MSWNGKEKLEKLYRSLLPALEGINYAWVIKDNGSVDGSHLLIDLWGKETQDRIRCYKWKNNLENYSQGNNTLFHFMNVNNDDYILLLNNDIIFQDDASIKKMISILDNDSEIGVVGAKLNYESQPKIIQHCGVLYHPMNVGTPFHWRAGRKEEIRDCQNRFYPAVTGAILLTRASLYREVGGLPEQLHWCWDDIWYCLAVGEKGKKVVYCGETNILHSESATLKKNPVNKLYFTQNIRYFMNRWGSKIDKGLVEKYTKDPDYMLYT